MSKKTHLCLNMNKAMDISEIERQISSGEITSAQVFTQMKRYVISRNDILNEAIGAVCSCELVEPTVKRIRLHEALGAIDELKSR